MFVRTKANANLSATITNNSVDTNFVGAAEMRLETNANDAGDVVAPTQCDDISGNTFPAGVGAIIDINETNGTHNVEQASALAVTAANGGTVIVTPDLGVSFGVACAAPPALQARGGEGPGGTLRPLSAEDLDLVSPYAIASGGASEIVRRGVSKFSVAELPLARLATVEGGDILVDLTAAGWGWFVDPTPDKDEEFEPSSAVTGERLAKPDGPAAGKMDLLTALMHEMGHMLGKPDLAPASSPGDLMAETLPVGVRRGPIAIAASSTQSAALETALPAGESLTVRIGTLPGGKTVTVTYQVTITEPLTGLTELVSQNVVSGSNFAPLLTDDPDTPAPGDPTRTSLLPICTATITLSPASLPSAVRGVTRTRPSRSRRPAATRQ